MTVSLTKPAQPAVSLRKFTSWTVGENVVLRRQGRRLPGVIALSESATRNKARQPHIVVVKITGGKGTLDPISGQRRNTPGSFVPLFSGDAKNILPADAAQNL